MHRPENVKLLSVIPVSFPSTCVRVMAK